MNNCNLIDVALVSDAGLPLISDPGYELVVEARHQNILGSHRPWSQGLTAQWRVVYLPYVYVLGFYPEKRKKNRCLTT